MAHMTKDGSVKGQKADGGSLSKPPLKTLIIPAKELVQVIAKVLAVCPMWSFVLWGFL